MREEERELTIGGRRCSAKLLFLEESDRPKIRRLFVIWDKLNKGMKLFRSRGVNMLEGISESAFCLEMGPSHISRVIKVSNEAGSFDTIDLRTMKRQQIKATSVENDLTSFGPKSVWDEIYWLDFYRDGRLDGSFDIYKIPNNLIYSHRVNRTQTFRQQQAERRRPRMRIRQIIEENRIGPIKTGRI